MGDIARALSFVRSIRDGARITDVKVNPDGGSNRTVEHFDGAGEDAHPLTTDYAVLVPIQGTGRGVAAGYADTKNAPKTGPGEKRSYGRNPDTGAPVNEVWLKSDGAVFIETANS